MNLKICRLEGTQSQTEMYWYKRKGLKYWSKFTDHQLQKGSACAKTGPGKLEPEKLIRVGETKL